MAKASKRRFRKLTIESLETRRVLASLPFGAEPSDTAEFMLGRIAVTPVLLESDGTLDASTEDWTPQQINQVMANIESGLRWWTDLLATQSSVHTLDWVIDRTFVDNRLPTPYEPISRTSNSYALWVSKFLGDVGFANSASLEVNVREFNNSQREKLNTDWSFTIFVVNSSNDADGSFATGGSFSRAFAFAGGLFQVIPSTRPASTYAHETGHMFWARDEYTGSGTYNQRRGYYNAQNLNAMDLNPNPTFAQAPSIMSSGLSLEMAWSNVVSPPSTLAQIGWKDSDGDGIFDVLDVPLALQGTGRMSENGQTYQFTGSASVQTLPNLNSAGSQRNISLNHVDRIEYRINGGNWFTAATPGTYTAQLNLSIPLSESTGVIEIRAIDAKLGITSNIFQGTLGAIPDQTTGPGIQGFVWEDRDNDNVWDANEVGLARASVTLVDEQGNPLQMQHRVDASSLADGPLPSTLSGVRIDAIGLDTDGSIFVGPITGGSSGSKTFKTNTVFGRAVETFGNEDQQFRARFDQPTSYAAVDIIAVTDNTEARLEAYDSNGTLLQRSERLGLTAGQRVTLSVGSSNADIAYVIARGFDFSHIKVSSLTYGSPNSTLTSTDGSYSFPYLPEGTYTVKIVGPNVSFVPSEGSSALQTLELNLGESLIHTDFGFYQIPSPWRNPTLPEDIDGDRSVSPVDVLELINEINRNGSRSLDSSTLVSPPYWDPDGDRFIGPLDVLQVINYINQHGVVNPGNQFSFAANSEQEAVTQTSVETSNESSAETLTDSSSSVVQRVGVPEGLQIQAYDIHPIVVSAASDGEDLSTSSGSTFLAASSIDSTNNESEDTSFVQARDRFSKMRLARESKEMEECSDPIEELLDSDDSLELAIDRIAWVHRRWLAT